MPNKIFISHATADDNFVTQLRKALEYKGLDVWIDSQNLRGGDILKTEIESAIKDASAFIVVISNNTFDSIIVNRGVLQVSKEAYMLSSRQIHNLNFFL
ncbi:molecular chaperone Tir [Candidatus Magnetomorum sp. HK-1]|nr:molecular chaperone Tir [Candidatus Magnetomorum sp. HK-1]